eukprot:6209605-Pleurochrysis_carterae.AAC.2
MDRYSEDELDQLTEQLALKKNAHRKLTDNEREVRADARRALSLRHCCRCDQRLPRQAAASEASETALCKRLAEVDDSVCAATQIRARFVSADDQRTVIRGERPHLTLLVASDAEQDSRRLIFCIYTLQ